MTYHSHNEEKLNRLVSVYDWCFVYIPNCLLSSARFSNAQRRIVCVQSDDATYIYNKAFSDLDKRMSAEVDTNCAKFCEEGIDLKFNSTISSRENRTNSTTQISYVKKFAEIDVNTATKDEQVAERARGAYITVTCHPQVTYAFSIASEITDLQKNIFKNLKKMIRTMLNRVDKGIEFVSHDLDSLVMAIFVDADFAANADSSS